MSAEGGAFAEEALRLLLDRLPHDRRTRIADVGANPLTPPPYADLLKIGGCEVIGFEPHDEAFAELENAKGSHETYINAAVGDGSTQELRITKASGLTSVFPPYEGAFHYLGRSRRNMQAVRTVPLTTCRLDDLPELGRIDALKIDIQGGEVAVFEGGAKTLGHAMAIITEVRFYPIYEGEPMFGGVDACLRDLGFVLHKMLDAKAKVIPNSQIERLRRQRHRNQVLDGDAVYISDPGQCGNWSDSDFAHLAILSAGVFASHDLALFCIDRLIDRNAVASSLAAAYVDALPEDLRRD